MIGCSATLVKLASAEELAKNVMTPEVGTVGLATTVSTARRSEAAITTAETEELRPAGSENGMLTAAAHGWSRLTVKLKILLDVTTGLVGVSVIVPAIATATVVLMVRPLNARSALVAGAKEIEACGFANGPATTVTEAEPFPAETAIVFPRSRLAPPRGLTAMNTVA